ncbi:MAG: type II toxin-antitoxin system VapC family toxin [Caldimonas sp.]
MILVDSSVWIDHLRRPVGRLAALLRAGQVACHPFVIGEIACGRVRERARFLTDLALLPQMAVATHAEALAFVESNRLAGGGIGWVDVHLLASTVLATPSTLWSRDKRLMAAAERLGVCFVEAGAP